MNGHAWGLRNEISSPFLQLKCECIIITIYSIDPKIAVQEYTSKPKSLSLCQESLQSCGTWIWTNLKTIFLEKEAQNQWQKRNRFSL